MPYIIRDGVQVNIGTNSFDTQLMNTTISSEESLSGTAQNQFRINEEFKSALQGGGVLTTTADVTVSTPTSESLSGVAVTQQQINRENKIAIEVLTNETEATVGLINTYPNIFIPSLPASQENFNQAIYQNYSSFQVTASNSFQWIGICDTTAINYGSYRIDIADTNIGGGMTIELALNGTSPSINIINLNMNGEVANYCLGLDGILYIQSGIDQAQWTVQSNNTNNSLILSFVDGGTGTTPSSGGVPIPIIDGSMYINGSQIATSATLSNFYNASIKLVATGTLTSTATFANFSVLTDTNNSNVIAFNGSNPTQLLIRSAGRYIITTFNSFGYASPLRSITFQINVNSVARLTESISNISQEFTNTLLLDIASSDIISGNAIVQFLAMMDNPANDLSYQIQPCISVTKLNN